MSNVTALNIEILVGYNANYGDIVTLENIDFHGCKYVCRIFEGRRDDKETTAIGYKCENT